VSAHARTIASTAGLLLAAWLASASALAVVPTPTVSGPIPATVTPGNALRDYPWLTTMHNLGAVGFVEEEFFYQGTARRFTTTGPLGTNGTEISNGHPYKTRLLVRRPLSSAQFNGTVIVEWQNVTAGYDLDAMWGGSYDHFIRAGYAWVGVSAQRVGVQGTPNGLRNWSPLRYGTLDVTAGGTFVAGDPLSFDIFAQAIQSIRTPSGVNVLGGLPVQRVLAVGASQSAAFLGTFINSLHPVIGESIDAYLLYIGGPRIRTDLNVPVFKLLSETDVPGQVAARQDDTERFRHWEVTGSSHSGRRTAMNSRPLVLRDGVQPAVGQCTFPEHPRIPNYHVTAAVFDHMVRWVRDGVAPPIAPRITTVGNVIQRDDFGNALGGIRLAEFAVPTATNTGANSGAAFCVLYGRYLPFAIETINELYPNHGRYVSAIDAQAQATVDAGYVLPEDAERTRMLAARSIIGTGDPCNTACRQAQDLLEESLYYLYTAQQAGDALASAAIEAIKTIAKSAGSSGKPAQTANESARSTLQRYIDDIATLQSRGVLSSVSAAELTTQAQSILSVLP
jgi:hypothetical protein